jgi:maltooligosyltrehalose trehalohydrolase
MNTAPPPLGSAPLPDGSCRFCVWAPFVDTVEVHLLSPREEFHRLARAAGGCHAGIVAGVEAGALYRFRLDGGRERADPASRYQPQGVHGPSQVVPTSFAWTDAAWRGMPLERYLIYELHVGTFTPQGSFAAVAGQLAHLKALGVTAVELMPVAQFPGERNWGYDGVFPFAAQSSYGGPEGLKRLVNACHEAGLAVILDVVYNHLGPEGNCLGDYGPYFSSHYRTPWGAPLNFDGPHSDGVRRYFIENALYWVADCHIDALRLDAVHAILDFSARPFLQELAEAVSMRAAQLGRAIHLIAESALNDTRLIRRPEIGGFGLDAQWSDDLHHALHALVTGERHGYYCDFGEFGQLLKALREGFVYDGAYSEYRHRRHGNSSRGVPPERLVVFAQNHDQVGNRMRGERLGEIASFEALKMMAAVVILSPYLPLVFMGEEYAEPAPFPYFISHADPELIAAVRRGRQEEFAAFRWAGEPPDPQAEETFLSATLDLTLPQTPGPNRTLFDFYRRLIELRRGVRALAELDKDRLDVFGFAERRVGFMHRRSDGDEAFMVFHAADAEAAVDIPLPPGSWRKALDSSEARWGGPGSRTPEVLESGAENRLRLPAFNVFLLVRPSG